jgi:hypothetical protein
MARGDVSKIICISSNNNRAEFFPLAEKDRRIGRLPASGWSLFLARPRTLIDFRHRDSSVQSFSLQERASQDNHRRKAAFPNAVLTGFQVS